MPDNYTQHSGPSQLTLEVTFRSRLFENTTAAWSRDAVPIPENQIQTVPVNDSHGTTTLSFPSTSRNNSGVYWVVIENNSPFIPEEMRRAVVTFQLRILSESVMYLFALEKNFYMIICMKLFYCGCAWCIYI